MKQITLKASRVNANLTRQEMADKLGVSKESVRDWETGRTKIRMPNLIAFCSVTGFETGDIILP